MQADKFYHVDKLMAMAIVQGGSGFPFFASSVYAYLCGSPLAAIKVPTEEVPNFEVKVLLDQVNCSH